MNTLLRKLNTESFVLNLRNAVSSAPLAGSARGLLPAASRSGVCRNQRTGRRSGSAWLTR